MVEVERSRNQKLEQFKNRYIEKSKNRESQVKWKIENTKIRKTAKWKS